MLDAIQRCLDFTRLEQADTPMVIAQFADKALQSLPLAAICVYPGFVSQLAPRFEKTSVKLATVVNFPRGDVALPLVLSDIAYTLSKGANEIDCVIPYSGFSDQSDTAALVRFVQQCKAACGDASLKVILESGAFSSQTALASAARACLVGGADFLKTSTGKISTGATTTAVKTLISVLKRFEDETGEARGLKVSGGVRTLADATQYATLFTDTFGADALTPERFRIGASALLDALLTQKNMSNSTEKAN